MRSLTTLFSYISTAILFLISIATATLTMMAEEPVTRIAAFKFLPTTSQSKISNRAHAFLALYAEHPELIRVQPKGGKSLRVPLDFDGTGVTGQLEWDLCFVVVFQDDGARKQFDSDPGHKKIKEETDPLLEKVFVYDFEEQNNLGW